MSVHKTPPKPASGKANAQMPSHFENSLIKNTDPRKKDPTTVRKDTDAVVMTRSQKSLAKPMAKDKRGINPLTKVPNLLPAKINRSSIRNTPSDPFGYVHRRTSPAKINRSSIRNTPSDPFGYVHRRTSSRRQTTVETDTSRLQPTVESEVEREDPREEFSANPNLPQANHC